MDVLLGALATQPNTSCSLLRLLGHSLFHALVRWRKFTKQLGSNSPTRRWGRVPMPTFSGLPLPWPSSGQVGSSGSQFNANNLFGRFQYQKTQTACQALPKHVHKRSAQSLEAMMKMSCCFHDSSATLRPLPPGGSALQPWGGLPMVTKTSKSLALLELTYLLESRQAATGSLDPQQGQWKRSCHRNCKSFATTALKAPPVHLHSPP